ncbi:non-ribosomal peptide synthetase [Streptomyces lydicus]|uniref:non-ribosomal peptide synthetase n=1 Tax=Streptomyces lydicus TaxID=47763 RepID=UPI0010121979|nr:non-ribosomal peptide synthetase [Streptomyces lydicus]
MTQPMTARTPVPTTASGTRLPASQGSLSIARGAAPATEGTSGVLARFEEWTRRSPEAPAVIDGAHRWTYRDIDAAADEAVRALRDRVRPGDLVGVCLDRSAALVVTAVALARIGAVYLPMGPRPGERRTEAVTEDLNVVCLIGDPEVLPPRHRSAEHLPLALPAEGANATATVVAAFAAPGSTARSAPSGAFYAVLTSGSTGRPKAVAVGEPALAAVLDWYRATSGVGPGDRQSLLIGVAFDPHLLELWAGLTSGAPLVPAPDEVRWDPMVLADWWQEAAVTVCVAATPMVEPLLERPWSPDLTLRHLFVGGDRMRRRPGKDVTTTVHNAYGPAEATVVSTVHTMRGSDDAAGTDAAPPIGHPLPGVTVVVADPDGRPVARGTEGELLIGGGALALGYLDPELTARRFRAVPKGLDLPGVERLYRTGDRVRMSDDGALEFLGRLDGQVKISGVRIEPAEVEAAFEKDPSVLGAVVTAPRTADGHTRLVAYVRPAAGTALTADALLPAVRAWLPEQAVPSDVRIVDAFPLDANGKVDRAELTRQAAAGAPGPGDAPADGGGLAGTTPGERLVLSAVRDLLARSEVSLTESFTGAGGTSLLAARLLTVIEKESGVRLRAPELLRQPDLRAVALLVDTRLAARQPAGA